MQQQNNNTYNQPPMGQMMPPPQMGMPRQMGAPRPRGWRERWMQRFGMSGQVPRAKELTIPNWLTGKSMVFFFAAMFACFLAFGYPMEFRDALISGLSVVLFFYGGLSLSKSWERKKEKVFVRNIFIAGLIVRLIWVFYCYFIFNPDYWGTTFGDGADVEWYMPFGRRLLNGYKGKTEYPLKN